MISRARPNVEAIHEMFFEHRGLVTANTVARGLKTLATTDRIRTFNRLVGEVKIRLPKRLTVAEGRHSFVYDQAIVSTGDIGPTHSRSGKTAKASKGEFVIEFADSTGERESITYRPDDLKALLRHNPRDVVADNLHAIVLHFTDRLEAALRTREARAAARRQGTLRSG
jgi:hypothetical protein